MNANGKKTPRATAPHRTSSGAGPQAARPRERVARVDSAEALQPGDTIVVTIKRLGINGEGIGYFKRKAVFVNGALPGEVVRVRVKANEGNRLVAETVRTEKRSERRVSPPCPLYGPCGGCQLQHAEYAAQLLWKEELIREAFARYAGVDDLPLRPMIGMDHPWAYRNKAQLMVGGTPGRVTLGLYRSGTRRLVDLASCPVQHPALNEAAERIRTVVNRLRIPPYDPVRRTGVLRAVVLRVAFATGRLQVTYVTTQEHFPARERLVRETRQALPNVAGIAQSVHDGRSHEVFGETVRTLWGDPFLEEKLGEVPYELSPRAFFQLNPAQAIRLYDTVKEAAALTGKETVLDLYCGAGTISLWLAPYAREVIGVESVPEAVEDARRNAALAGRSNVRFECARAEEALPRWARQGMRPDVIVADPPRTGLGKPLIDAIAKVRPARFVYVSCNPATLAKDTRLLLEAGYRLEWAQPVDMFPQTSHVESVILMVRKGA